MHIPLWTKPALYGAAAGAIAVAFIGFSWGGWVTGGTATEMASAQAASDVTSALTPYCVGQSTSAANRVSVLAELDDASSYARRGIIEKAGWATPLGTESPNRDLASACALALEDA